MRTPAAWLLAPALLLAAAASGAWSVDRADDVFPPGAPGSWDDTQVDAPVVRRQGGELRMWYRGCQLLGVEWAAWRCAVGHARSRDGVRWEREPDPVLRHDAASEDERIVSLAVVRDGEGGFRLWYGVRDPWAGGPCVVHAARSPDGLAFAPRGPVLEVDPPGRLGCPLAALRDEGRLHLWIVDREERVFALHHLVAAEEGGWRRLGHDLLVGAKSALGPFVVWKEDGAFRLLHALGPGAPHDAAFGRLRSTDGTHWERDAAASPERAALGEDRFAAGVAVAPGDGGRRLWFAEKRPTSRDFVRHFGGIGRIEATR